MTPAERLPNPLYEIAETHSGEIVVRFLVNITVHTAPTILKELRFIAIIVRHCARRKSKKYFF